MESTCPVCGSGSAASLGTKRLGHTDVRCRNCGYVYVVDTSEREEEGTTPYHEYFGINEKDYGDDDVED